MTAHNTQAIRSRQVGRKKEITNLSPWGLHVVILQDRAPITRWSVRGHPRRQCTYQLRILDLAVVQGKSGVDKIASAELRAANNHAGLGTWMQRRKRPQFGRSGRRPSRSCDWHGRTDHLVRALRGQPRKRARRHTERRECVLPKELPVATLRGPWRCPGSQRLRAANGRFLSRGCGSLSPGQLFAHC
jgi:hypothetical protein